MRMNRRHAISTVSKVLLGCALIYSPSNLASGRLKIDVTSFGAKGDGKKDDSAAVRAALKTAPDILHFPTGNYCIDSVEIDLNGVTIDAPNATFINNSEGKPAFSVSAGSKVMQSSIVVGGYKCGVNAGYFLELCGGLVSDCVINVRQAIIKSPVGGVIRHYSTQASKGFTEGLYFTNVVGHRWTNAAKKASVPMIDIASNFNTFSACNISVRDIRLLSSSVFFRAICSSSKGAAFNQIKLHDLSIEKSEFGAIRFEGARMSGIENVGFFDLKGFKITCPLIVFLGTPQKNVASGYYCRDVFRATTSFTSEGCDLLVNKNSVTISNYIAVGGLLVREA